MKQITTRHLVRRLVIDLAVFWFWVYCAHSAYSEHNHAWLFLSVIFLAMSFAVFARDVRRWNRTPDWSKMFRS